MTRVERQAVLATMVEVLLPSRCAGCDASLPAGCRALCATCWGEVVPWQGASCPRCAGPSADDGDCLACSEAPPPQAGTVVWGEHTGTLRAALLALKHGGRDELAGPLGRRLAARLAVAPWLDQVDLVVAVPSHLLYRLRRGYAAAELLARGVAAEIGRPWQRLLTRRGLDRQAGRSRLQRQRLGGRRFVVNGVVARRRLLVVDDVLTTGATLRQVTAALLAAGADTVYCAALASAPAARRMT